MSSKAEAPANSERTDMTHVTIEREALQTVLEALESCDQIYGSEGSHQYFSQAMVDKAITAIKQTLAAQPAPGMAVQAIAGEIIEALLADEKDGGYDLTAGMFGPAFSKLVRRWANAEWATTPPAQPCQTCEALARTVMMDQTGRDA
jgi:hypothetical protein